MMKSFFAKAFSIWLFLVSFSPNICYAENQTNYSCEGDVIDFKEIKIVQESSSKSKYFYQVDPSINEHPLKLVNLKNYSQLAYRCLNKTFFSTITKKTEKGEFEAFVVLKQKNYSQTGDDSVYDKIRFVSLEKTKKNPCYINQIKSNDVCYFMMRIKKLNNSNTIAENKLNFDFYDPEIISGLDDSAVFDKAIEDFLKGDIILLDSNPRLVYKLLYNLINASEVIKEKNTNFSKLLEHYNFSSTLGPDFKYSLKPKVENENISDAYLLDKDNLDKSLLKTETINKSLNRATYSTLRNSKIIEIYNISLKMSDAMSYKLTDALEKNSLGYREDICIMLRTPDGSILAKTDLLTIVRYFDEYVENDDSEIFLIDRARVFNGATAFYINNYKELVFSRYIKMDECVNGNCNERDIKFIAICAITGVILMIALIFAVTAFCNPCKKKGFKPQNEPNPRDSILYIQSNFVEQNGVDNHE